MAALFTKQLRLSGPPKIAGVLFPYPSDAEALDSPWQPEHRTKEALSGKIKIVQRRYRGIFKLGWIGLDQVTHDALIAAIEAKTFTFTPRTVGLGETQTVIDPLTGAVIDLLEVYSVRSVGPVQVTGKTQRGQDERYDISIELRTVDLFGDPTPTGVAGGAPSNGGTTTTPGSTGESGGGSTTTLDCPTEVFFLILDPSAPGPALTDTSNVTLSADADGVARFTKFVRESRGYSFGISSITFKTLSPVAPASPANAFNYTICAESCAPDPSDPSNASAGAVAERQIDFEILLSEIASGTYTVAINVIFDCDTIDTALTFTITKT